MDISFLLYKQVDCNSMVKTLKYPPRQERRRGRLGRNSTCRLEAWGPFLEIPVRAVVVFMQDRGLNSFASNVIKLSVNETKRSSLLAGTRALILYISI